MTQLTSLNGEFTFADRLARTVGVSGPQRAANFYESPGEVQDATWCELRREVEAREHTARAEVVG